ncbi:YbhB/YbcL family Raf kinase inhibitor-like protein [Paenibacillus caui]|uniref:YbhB/YbcL family Raf kinase inhibitor-like protein n=1 Tax=Paenibacillus caui TaxID=2873927 RepID=UPI001CA8218A|nr:YbhB/YbcL family Raf kinase inhibitor-like protein [Paenibacillus caui]
MSLNWKKYMCMLAAGAALVWGSSVSNVSAAGNRDVSANVNSYLQWNSAVHIELDSAPLGEDAIMENSQILVPLRAVFEAAGAKVSWNAASNTVTAEGKGYKLTHTKGARSVSVNGVRYELDHESVVSGGRLMVSERAVPLALQASLYWNSAERTLSIVSAADKSGGLQMKSPSFEQFGSMPAKYAHQTGSGHDISPPVSWSHAPEGTKSFAVVMYDIHPIADNYIHWSVLNVPATVHELAEDAAFTLPAQQQPNAYFGMGPPPFSGDHLYRLAVYALDTEQLELKDKVVFFDELEPLLKAHELGHAEWDGFFKSAVK